MRLNIGKNQVKEGGNLALGEQQNFCSGCAAEDEEQRQERKEPQSEG